MILQTIILGLLVFIVLRMQMIQGELTWIRKYLIQKRANDSPFVDSPTQDFQKDTDSGNHIGHAPSSDDLTDDDAKTASMPFNTDRDIAFEDNLGESIMQAVMSAQRMSSMAPSQSVQIEEVVESDVELEDADDDEARSVKSSECSTN